MALPVSRYSWYCRYNQVQTHSRQGIRQLYSLEVLPTQTRTLQKRYTNMNHTNVAVYLQMVVLQVFFYAIFLHITSAERCACATGNVHMRDGAGVTHNVVGTMTPGECVSYKGDKIPVGSMQWAHVEYNGNVR